MTGRSPIPTELEDRRRLLGRVVPLLSAVSATPAVTLHSPAAGVWRPPFPEPADTPCPAPAPPAPEPTPTVARPIHVELISDYTTYNRKLAGIATMVPDLKEVLMAAGLSEADARVWHRHRLHTEVITSRSPGTLDRPPEDCLYVADRGYRGDFTHLAEYPYFDETIERMQKAEGLLSRLRTSAHRLERTLSPEAVLGRFWVSKDRKLARLDCTEYGSLAPRSEGLLLEHVRRAAGGWASSTAIEAEVGVVEFKVSRAIASLRKKHSKLAEMLETAPNNGTRIILPLPPPAK